MTEKESTGKSTKVARPSKKQAKKKRRIWPWVVLAFLLVFVALPAGLFAYAYSQYTVPEPKDLANNQVSTIYAGDNQTQLARLVPPATVIDKRVYSPWLDTGLDGLLRERGVETLIVTGAETDVCVLASVLGAVDLGYRVIVVTDDGHGPRGSSEGNGLRGLRERVEPAGGRVSVEPADPGTRVEVRL